MKKLSIIVMLLAILVIISAIPSGYCQQMYPFYYSTLPAFSGAGSFATTGTFALPSTNMITPVFSAYELYPWYYPDPMIDIVRVNVEFEKIKQSNSLLYMDGYPAYRIQTQPGLSYPMNYSAYQHQNTRTFPTYIYQLVPRALAFHRTMFELAWYWSGTTPKPKPRPSGGTVSVTLFHDDFNDILNWEPSDDSTYIVDDDFMYISSDGVTNPADIAERDFSIDLSDDYEIVVEQRVKLESGGHNYRLPWEHIYFEDDTRLSITYLPDFPPDENVYGWCFVDWTGIHDNAVPGEGYLGDATADYWTVTRAVLSASGGELYMKPDDAERGWFSDDFSLVTTAEWSHSQVTKIEFSQPWDSSNFVDYITIKKVTD